MTNNIDNLASYLQLESLIYNQNYTNPTEAGSAESLFNSTFGYDPSVVQEPIDYPQTNENGEALPNQPATAAWNLGLIDFLANTGSPTLNYSATDLTAQYPVIYYNNVQYEWLAVNLADLTDYQSLAQIYQFYQNNPYDQNTTNWYESSGEGSTAGSQDYTWWFQDTQRSDFFQYYNQLLNIQSGGSVNSGIESPPPTTFAGFVELLLSLQVYTGATDSTDATNGHGGVVATAANVGTNEDPSLWRSYIPGTSEHYAPSTDSSGNIIGAEPSITLVAQPYPAATGESALQAVLVNFLANYRVQPSSDPGSQITPQAFAQAWENYISGKISGPPPNSNSIQINLVSTGADGVTNVMAYKTVPIPGYSGTNATSFTGNFGTFPQTFANELYSEYTAALQTATDWQGVSTSGLNVQASFDNAFDFFIRQVVSQNLLASGQNFFQLWSEFIGPSTYLQNATNGGSNDLTTYQELYNVFYPNQPSGFLPDLNTFIQNALNQPSGVFNPSLLIDQWFTDLEYNSFETLPTTLDAGDYDETAIINTVFTSIIDMINSLQQLTVAEANRLNFYSAYQQAYTSAMQAIPEFTPNDGSPIGSTDTTTIPAASGNGNVPTNLGQINAGLREDADAASNKWIQNFRSYRSTIGDLAQSQQSVITQTNSEVDSETDIATNLLQVINQIMSSIFSSLMSNSNSNTA